MSRLTRGRFSKRPYNIGVTQKGALLKRGGVTQKQQALEGNEVGKHLKGVVLTQ